MMRLRRMLCSGPAGLARPACARPGWRGARYCGTAASRWTLAAAKRRATQVRRSAVVLLRARGVLVLGMGNLLLLSGYLMSDQKLLRALCASGSFLGILFNLSRQPPVWPNVAWGGVFVGANCAMLLMLLHEGEWEFSQCELEMYEQQFMPHEVSPRQFHQLIQRGRWRHVPAGHVLCAEGAPLNRVMLVHSGRVAVKMSGHSVAWQLVGGEPGAFVGEASFLEVPAIEQEEMALVSATAVEPSCVFEWESGALREVLRRDQVLALQATTAFSLALVNKLRAGSAQVGNKYYQEVIQVVTADGRVPPEEKREVRRFRKHHQIGYEQHLMALEQVGWSEEEWEDGAKHSRALRPSRVMNQLWRLFG